MLVRRSNLICSLFAATLFLVSFSAVKSEAIDNTQVSRITVEEVQTMLATGEEVVFIDTRNSGQWAKAKDKIPGALRLTNNRELADFSKEHPDSTAIVTYCT